MEHSEHKSQFELILPVPNDSEGSERSESKDLALSLNISWDLFFQVKGDPLKYSCSGFNEILGLCFEYVAAFILNKIFLGKDSFKSGALFVGFREKRGLHQV
ncbi:MAG: hypothetical protein KKC50_07690, partial [Candidatus Omnitrophica bacterium]|nr:hypothetical protein [Candidatus Omnitrophota bacterium]